MPSQLSCLKNAVSLLGRERAPTPGATDFFDDLESLYPDRQHAFESNVVFDPHGNTVLPMHHPRRIRMPKFLVTEMSQNIKADATGLDPVEEADT